MSEQSSSEPIHRRPDRVALAIALLLAAIGITIAVNMFMLRALPSAERPGQVGPKVIPYLVAIGFLILSVLTALAALRGKFPEREKQELGPVAWIVGGLVAQIALLHITGFSVATGILFAFTAKGFGRGPLWFSIPIGIVISFAVWFIFAKLLQLSLPAGPVERLITTGRI